MKRFTCVAFAFSAFLALSALTLWQGAGFAAQAAQKEITVFAAASMTESLNKIAALYKKTEPDVKIIYNFDSSGTLKTQIQQGADCDIFISAAQKQMDQIDITANPAVNTEKLDFIMDGTRFNLVANKVVLIVPKGAGAAKISGFADAATDKVSLVSLGNSDVPAGQYAREIFTKLGLWEELNKQKKISFAGNVKEVLSQVAAGAVDCGVVYGTDAAASKEVAVVAEAPAGSHRPVVYPAAVLKRTKYPTEAKAFAEFLRGREAAAIFAETGFAVPAK